MPQKLQERTALYYQGPVDPYNTSTLKAWIKELEGASVLTVEELDIFVSRFNEFVIAIKDSMAEIYIAMTCNTADKELETKYTAYHENVIAYTAPFDFGFKKKILGSPALKDWAKQEGLASRDLLIKFLQKDVNAFREENIPLGVEESGLAVQYRSISGGMTVEFQGQEKTLPELGVYLKDPSRSLREEAWKARAEKMASHEKELQTIFDQLLVLRQKIAANAGFKNYRDFAHVQKGRFSYSVEDVLNFQEAVEAEIVPLVKELNTERQKGLKLDNLRPWDLSVSLDGKVLCPAKPEDLADAGINILNATDNWTGNNFASMKASGLLDLVNRKNKAPGGYSYPLSKYGASFIFMNAVGIHSDLTTLVHEAGHAMHEFGSANLPYTGLFELPMEAAELASMSMEMLSMPHWNIVYDAADHKKSMRDQLEDAIRFFPWCVTVDGFQQKIYTENLDASGRNAEFVRLSERFSSATGVDWSNLNHLRQILWLFQLHIFEVPFYYIEYGIAQLGALAVYRKYKQNARQALADYKSFLNLGPCHALEKLYKTAGIELKFTRAYVKEIADFVREEIGNFK